MKTPMYKESYDYAVRNGEKDLFFASSREDRNCLKAIQDTAKLYDVEKMRYPAAEAAKAVLKEFGAERVCYIMAMTVQHYNYDGRISRDNKDWAASYSPNHDGDVSRYAVSNGELHSGLIDMFCTSMRKEPEVAAFEKGRGEELDRQLGEEYDLGR